jgi:hypothetical protein
MRKNKNKFTDLATIRASIVKEKRQSVGAICFTCSEVLRSGKIIEIEKEREINKNARRAMYKFCGGRK